MLQSMGSQRFGHSNRTTPSASLFPLFLFLLQFQKSVGPLANPFVLCTSFYGTEFVFQLELMNHSTNSLFFFYLNANQED